MKHGRFNRRGLRRRTRALPGRDAVHTFLGSEGKAPRHHRRIVASYGDSLRRKTETAQGQRDVGQGGDVLLAQGNAWVEGGDDIKSSEPALLAHLSKRSNALPSLAHSQQRTSSRVLVPIPSQLTKHRVNC